MSRSFSKRSHNTRTVLSVAVMLTAIFAEANDSKYPVSAIPEHLTKNADVVKRIEEVEFEIKSTGSTILHYKYVLTILNENGDKYARFSEWYDQLKHVGSLKGNLYDAKGNLIKKMRNKEVSDISASEEWAEDDRIKEFDFYCRSYPYTVEFEASVYFDHTFYFPEWKPQEFPNLSVEKSVFKVITPSDYLLRYKNFNYNSEPSQSFAKNKKIYYWQIEDLSSLKWQPFSPSWQEMTTTVYVAPTQFEVHGIKGNMTSWREFGNFIYQLKKGRDELPSHVKQKILDLTATAQTGLEKVQILYNYLQQNTRYISIQLGIGGWQPFDAMYVSKKGYGDCKALTNYMYSLLKAAGIRSYYALVKAGDNDHFLIEDFPCNQFNHVILCVPLQKDTVWLECTNQTMPTGYLSEFTGNRKALLVDETGGILVSTPKYGLHENVLKRELRSKLDEAGNLDMKVSTKYGGIQQDELGGMINTLSKDKLKTILQKSLELESYTLTDFSYEETKTVLPELNEQLQVEVNNYATVSGKRIFIVPNVLNRSNSQFLMDKERVVDIVFYSEWRDEDHCEIEIPEGYQPEAMPQDVSLKTIFGTYSCSVKLSGNKIIYDRVREQFSGRFPATGQAELAQFFDDIYKSDRNKIVLIKKTG